MAIDKNIILAESSTALGLTSFLGTAALFFTGLLIAQINNFSPTIKVPIVYLIISTLAFVFSAIIYANITGHIRVNSLKSASRFLLVANSLSEFPGVYLFVISIPMVLNAITQDILLRYVVELSVIASIVLYTYSSFSIFRRSFSQKWNVIFCITLTGLMAVLYGIQGVNNAIYTSSALLLIGLLLVATMLSDEVSSKGRRTSK